MENPTLRCIAHPGCQYPNCYCQVDNDLPRNTFKDKVDLVASELKRASIALGQFQKDLSEAEVENFILLTGLLDLIAKYEKDGTETENTTLKLLYGNIIQDLKSVVKVSQQSTADILSKPKK